MKNIMIEELNKSMIFRIILTIVLKIILYYLVQLDGKMIIAYSSLIVIISYGLYSSGLFYIVNIYYIYSYKWLIIINKGYIIYISTIII